MSEQTSPLYAKLLSETARISWQELQPFFARGALLKVAMGEDLVAIAAALAEDDRTRVAAWLDGGQLCKVEAEQAQDFLVRDPQLWAVVVAPWVVIQERAEKATLH